MEVDEASGMSTAMMGKLSQILAHCDWHDFFVARKLDYRTRSQFMWSWKGSIFFE